MRAVLRSLVTLVTCFFLAGLLAPMSFAQEPAAPPPIEQPAAPQVNINFGAEDDCGGCCPATTREKLVIGGASVGLFGVVFVLLRAAMVSALIRKDWSPLLASHSALSATLMVGSTGTTLVSYLVKGCWLGGFAMLSALLFGVWLVHLLFTLLAVRGR